MTAVLTLCLLASGVAWIINARSLGKKILGGVVLVSVFLAFAPCLLCTLGRLFKQHASFETGDYPLWPALVLLVLVFSGWFMWRRRELRARALEQYRRRHGQPRKRALPPAPPPDSEYP
jgi:hypothetical protein